MKQRRTFVTAERVRLVRPVELAGPWRVAVEVVLGALVIAQHRFDAVGVVHDGDTAGSRWGRYGVADPCRFTASSSGPTISIGNGKTMVEFLSAAITVSVSR